MKILTEIMLRAAALPECTTEYEVEPDVFVTPLAREYLRDRGISLKVAEKRPEVMTRKPLPKQGPYRYRDVETGVGYREKPESMTHLRENLLVSKNHPRIEFRGMLDSLQAEIICLQTETFEQGFVELTENLGEILEAVRQILGAEVGEKPMAELCLFGLTEDEIREHSHNVKKYLSMDHPIPDYSMGKMAAQLNRLRTRIRETELSAVRAFTNGEGELERTDIIQSLNRLSSGMYILFCRWLSGRYKGGGA